MAQPDLRRQVVQMMRNYLQKGPISFYFLLNSVKHTFHSVPPSFRLWVLSLSLKKQGCSFGRPIDTWCSCSAERKALQLRALRRALAEWLMHPPTHHTKPLWNMHTRTHPPDKFSSSLVSFVSSGPTSPAAFRSFRSMSKESRVQDYQLIMKSKIRCSQINNE